MAKITYTRGTTFPITVTYVPPASVAGQTALFTVKTTQFDTSSTDTTAILKKDIALTSNTGTGIILPTDIADTVVPGNYYYDVKVLDTSGAIYPITTDKFQLVATPTNRLT